MEQGVVLGTAVRCRGENTMCSLSLCSLHSHWDSDLHKTWVLRNTPVLPAFTSAVGSPQHCQQRDTWSTKGRWRGMSSPALKAEQAKMPGAQWLKAKNHSCTTGQYSLRIPLESLPSLCLGDRLSSNYGLLWKFHSPLSMSWLLHSWLFGKGSIKVGTKIIVLKSCHIARYLQIFLFTG